MQGICHELDKFYLFYILLLAIWLGFFVVCLDGVQSFHLNHGLLCKAYDEGSAGLIYAESNQLG